MRQNLLVLLLALIGVKCLAPKSFGEKTNLVLKFNSNSKVDLHNKSVFRDDVISNEDQCEKQNAEKFDECDKNGKLCVEDEENPGSYKCGDCKEGFFEDGGGCIDKECKDEFRNGISWLDNCKNQSAFCVVEKEGKSCACNDTNKKYNEASNKCIEIENSEKKFIIVGAVLGTLLVLSLVAIIILLATRIRKVQPMSDTPKWPPTEYGETSMDNNAEMREVRINREQQMVRQPSPNILPRPKMRSFQQNMKKTKDTKYIVESVTYL